jgi:hypothetical protein
MGKQKAVSILVTLVLLVAAGAAFVLWPKHYAVGQRIPETNVFWNDREAFLFLAESTTGRTQNVLQEKFAGTRYGYLAIFLGGYVDFTKAEVVAYHLVSSGQLDRFALPDHTTTFGSWGLTEGRLQLTASPAATGTGFRWDGEKFVSLSASAPPGNGRSDSSQPLKVSAACRACARRNSHLGPVLWREPVKSPATSFLLLAQKTIGKPCADKLHQPEIRGVQELEAT